jgi:glycosyltransferase involved in cell wall biosynthesis
MMKVGETLGLTPEFIGAYREDGLPAQDTWEDIPVKRVGTYYPMLNGKGIGSYLRGVWNFNRAAYKELKRSTPAVVHVSDIESFGASFLYTLRHRSDTRLLYNIHDNLAQRYPLPRPVNGLLNLVEGCIVNYSDITLVPEAFRAKALPRFCQQNIKVVRNTPIDPGKSSPPPLGPDTTVNILFAGWLDEGRGAEMLLRLADNLENVRITVAGEGAPSLAAKFKDHPNCDFKGFVTHHEVLELTKQAHFVFAHYSPHRIINRYAAPNKLAEALAVGRPAIINSEALVSQAITEKSCGLVSPYGDYKALKALLQSAIANPDAYNDMCTKARQLFDTDYSWSTAKEASKQVLTTLLQKKNQ